MYITNEVCSRKGNTKAALQSSVLKGVVLEKTQVRTHSFSSSSQLLSEFISFV